MEQTEFNTFFESYSKNVDNAEQVPFWAFSDTIVEQLLLQFMPTPTAGKVILDAGGGTGRWIKKLAAQSDAAFILYDLSTDMLTQARKNLSSLKERVHIKEGDLMNMTDIPSNSVDYIYSTYGVISFVSEPQKAVQELSRILKPGGHLLLMGHGYHNALASKINGQVAPKDEIDRMFKKMVVKWAPFVPELQVFSRERFEQMYQSAGLTYVKAFGIPVLVQPTPEDFDPSNKSIGKISKALTQKEYFESLYSMEMECNAVPTLVNRGVNIAAVAQKPVA